MTEFTPGKPRNLRMEVSPAEREEVKQRRFHQVSDNRARYHAIRVQQFFTRDPSTIYYSKIFKNKDGIPMRFVEQIFEDDSVSKLISIDDTHVVRTSPGGRQQLKALVLTDEEGMQSFILEQFRVSDDKPVERTSFSFTGEQIEGLIKFFLASRFVGKFDDVTGTISEKDLLRRILAE